MKRKIKTILRLIIIFSLIFLVYLESTNKLSEDKVKEIQKGQIPKEEIKYIPEQLETITSDSYLFYSFNLEKIYYEFNKDKKISPASITKLFTINEALKHVHLNEKVKIGPEIRLIGPNSSSAYLKEGTVYTVEELIYLMLIPSANDASYSLANYVGNKLNNGEKTIDNNINIFLESLNNSLNEKFINTKIYSVDGYDTESYTTANDLKSLLDHLLRRINIIEITEKSTITINNRTYQNTNALINSNKEEGKYYIENVNGLKTGRVSNKFNLIFSYIYKDELYIGMTFENKNNEELYNNSKLMIDSFLK